MSETKTWQINIEGAEGLCQWITDQGGPSGIEAPSILNIILPAFRYQTNVPNYDFVPTAPQVLGVIAYFKGDNDEGKRLTGCEFT